MKTSGRSESTLHNYSRHLAQMALHFNALPTELEDDQIEDYLYLLQQQHNTPSESYFKHTVYGETTCGSESRRDEAAAAYAHLTQTPHIAGTIV